MPVECAKLFFSKNKKKLVEGFGPLDLLITNQLLYP